MMYVEFMKNFLLADSSWVWAVRLILASWAQKHLIPTFYTSCTSSSWKIFFSPIRADGCNTELMAYFLQIMLVHSFIAGILSPKTCDSYFVDMMYVEFMKIFFSPIRASSLAVRLILASWAQKQVIPTL